MQCKLCHALDGSSDEPVLSRTAAGLVLLSSDWAVLGHLVVVAAQHVENLSELSDAAEFTRLAVAAERAVLAVTGADRAILMKLGLAVPHLHLHIYPVSNEATREEVFAAIDMKCRVELPETDRERFVKELRAALR